MLVVCLLVGILCTGVHSQSWVKHDGKDCYAGKGAVPMQPDPYSNSLSLDQCKSACLRSTGCEGIVRKRAEGANTGICYLRKSISLNRCATDYTWALYQVSRNAVANDWTKYSGLDCYQGRGGDPIQPDPYSNAISLSACKTACQRNSNCKGIVRKATDRQGNGICYLRKNLNMNSCARDATWDLYYRGKGTPGPTASPITNRPNNNNYGCKYGIQRYPRNLPNSHYYTRLCTTNQNLKVVSSYRATDAALGRTANLIGHVMANVDPSVARSMNARGFRQAVMGNYPSELTTHIPEHAFLDPGYWNERARGLGATVAVPVGSSAEENAMCYSNDRYRGEDITIHEFAHSMHLLGFALVYPRFNSELQGLYNAARYANLWGAGHYAMTDFKEYFAEGVQSYFNANMADPNAPTNRYQLRTREPNFYAFLDRYLGRNTWSWSCP